MDSQEIPQDRWERFFQEFSQSHQGEPVHIELLDPDLGDQPFAADAPLLGIQFDRAGSRAGAVEIMTGNDPDSVSTHVVGRPTHVHFAQEADGPGGAIEIRAGDGEPTALIRLLQRRDLPA